MAALYCGRSGVLAQAPISASTVHGRLSQIRGRSRFDVRSLGFSSRVLRVDGTQRHFILLLAAQIP